MPRDFDSDSPPQRLTFTENVICPACEEIFDGHFCDYTESQTFEDLVEPPVGVHACPGCGHQWRSEMTGWMFYTEAG